MVFGFPNKYKTLTATSTLVPRPSEDDIPPSRSSGAGISLDDTHIESVVSESGARRNSIVKTRSFLGLHKKGKEPEPSIPGGSGLPDIVEKSMHAKMSKRSSLLFLSIKVKERKTGRTTHSRLFYSLSPPPHPPKNSHTKARATNWARR